ncbi:MAG TPA: hypothetical protein PLJ35_14755 [Anaerolineae bacterium]|nr:hypothetical protein [Anaerolineae bacterium]HPL79570.1 hypothetical protein [Burkholderiaceae bacterium]
MTRVVFTRDEVRLLARLARARRQTPGEVLRQLMIEDALKRRLLEPEQPAQERQAEEAPK